MVKTPSDDVRVKFEQNHGLPSLIILVEMDEEETERKLGMMDPDRSPATTSGVVRRRFSRVGFLPWGGGLAVWVGYLEDRKSVV